MKADDLMIGDWVYDTLSQTNKKVNRGHFEINPLNGICYAENLYPIPLTVEILVKNGFKETPLGSWFCGGEHNIILTEDEVHWWTNIVSMIASGEISLSINYVHELQHTLKLCKIEKEIVL